MGIGSWSPAEVQRCRGGRVVDQVSNLLWRCGIQQGNICTGIITAIDNHVLVSVIKPWLWITEIVVAIHQTDNDILTGRVSEVLEGPVLDQDARQASSVRIKDIPADIVRYRLGGSDG